VGFAKQNYNEECLSNLQIHLLINFEQNDFKLLLNAKTA